MSMNNNYDIIVKGKPLSFPPVLNIAQVLDDANVQVFVKYKGTIPNIVTYSLSITDRLVVLQENITTPAGNFNTYKINSNLVLEINNNDNITTYNMTKEEWYSSGNGIVKSITLDGNGNLSNEKILCAVTF